MRKTTIGPGGDSAAAVRTPRSILRRSFSTSCRGRSFPCIEVSVDHGGQRVADRIVRCFSRTSRYSFLANPRNVLVAARFIRARNAIPWRRPRKSLRRPRPPDPSRKIPNDGEIHYEREKLEHVKVHDHFVDFERDEYTYLFTADAGVGAGQKRPPRLSYSTCSGPGGSRFANWANGLNGLRASWVD